MAGIAVPSSIFVALLAVGCASAAPASRAEAPPSVVAQGSAPASAPPTASASSVPAQVSAAPVASPSASTPVLVPSAAVGAASASSSAPTSPPPASAPLLHAFATFGDPAFDGGDVPKAKAALDKLKARIEKCVNAEGGVPADGASMKLQFLVRAQGIAEGIEVLDARNVGEKAGRCVRDAFKKKKVGAPSADPVGVKVTIDFSTKEPS